MKLIPVIKLSPSSNKFELQQVLIMPWRHSHSHLICNSSYEKLFIVSHSVIQSCSWISFSLIHYCSLSFSFAYLFVQILPLFIYSLYTLFIPFRLSGRTFGHHKRPCFLLDHLNVLPQTRRIPFWNCSAMPQGLLLRSCHCT